MIKLGLCFLLLCVNFLFATINGEKEELFIIEASKELNIPYKMNQFSSITDFFYEKESKSVIWIQNMSSDAVFNIKTLSEKYKRDYTKTYCEDKDLAALFGDDLTNKVIYRIKQKDKTIQEIVIKASDCN